MDNKLTRQYQRYVEADAEARKLWDKRDKEARKFVRMAKLGRKHSLVVPISDNRGVRIVNQFRTAEDKIFAPAFARKFEFKEVPLEG